MVSAVLSSNSTEQPLAIGAQFALGGNMPIQGLPGDTQFLAQVADLGFRLPHCRHCKAQLGGGHLEGKPGYGQF